MAKDSIRIPLVKLTFTSYDCDAYRLNFDLDIRMRGNRYARLPFRLDTATDLTTIPITMAETLKIPFSRNKPIFPNTAAGTATEASFVSTMWFSFPAIPQWRFRSTCLFTPYNLKQCLFSLADLIPHFTIKSDSRTSPHPHGSVVLQLKVDHGGQSRP